MITIVTASRPSWSIRDSFSSGGGSGQWWIETFTARQQSVSCGFPHRKLAVQLMVLARPDFYRLEP
jgi:hypothetical protein